MERSYPHDPPGGLRALVVYHHELRHTAAATLSLDQI